VIQQRLSGSTAIRAGFGPKNLIGGGLLDPGPGRLVEDLDQRPGMPAGFEGRPPQRRDAGDRHRSGHDLQEPAGDAEADPLGLGDGGELVLPVAGDLHGPLQSPSEGLDLGPLLSELPLKLVDSGLGRGAAHGLDDLLGLAVERLPRALAVVRHRGDVAVSAAEDGEGAGDTLRDRGHGGSLRRGQSRSSTHDCTRPDGNCPQITP
jgi:hypothetical protein